MDVIIISRTKTSLLEIKCVSEEFINLHFLTCILMAVPECVITFHRIQKQIYDTSQLWYANPYLELRGVATDNAADVAEIFEETHHHFHDALLLVEIVVLQLGALGLQRVHCRLEWKHSTSIWHSSVNRFFLM